MFINYIPQNPSSGGGGNSVFSAIVDTYADLPSGSSYIGKLVYVRTGSGGFLSGVGLYKYPAGTYATTDGTNWSLSTVQVEISDDTTTMVNITNWANFISTGISFSQGDIINFNKIQYQNLTGTFNSSDPSIDIINWEILDSGSGGESHKILSATHTDTLMDNVIRGDIIIGNSTPKWSRLPFPSSPIGKILQASATDIVWSTNSITIGASASISGSNTGDQTNITGNAGTVTNATFSTALTVNGGSVTLTGNIANNSVLTIGAGSVSISGSNTGDQIVPSNEAGSTNNFLTAYNSSTGTFSKAQPTPSNVGLSNVTNDTQIKASIGTAKGDLITFSASATPERIGAGSSAGNLRTDGSGNWSIDTATYLTSLSGAVLTNQSTPQSIGDTTNRLTKLWATDITVTNAISGNITGNAGTVSNGIYTTSDATSLAATIVGNRDKYLHSNASTGILEWVTLSAGSGDMILASAQSVTGLKTFDKDKLAMKGTSTGITTFSTANTGSTSYTATLPIHDFTFDNITTSTTSNGTGFIKSNGSSITFDNSVYLTSVTPHNLLSTTHGDTLADTVIRGDILIGNSTPKWARLAFPSTPTGKILQATATDVVWSTNPITIGSSASVSGSNTGDNATNSQYSGWATSKMDSLVTVPIKSTNYTANVNELIPCSISGGSFAITLPSAPANGSRMEIQLITIGAGNSLEVKTSGTDKFARSTGPTSLYLSFSFETLSLQYETSTGLWFVNTSVASSNFAVGFPGIDAFTPITNANISINYTSRELTIIPPLGYFNFFVDGGGRITRFRKNGNVLFPAFTDTSGFWYFYFNSAGSPISTQTPWTANDFSTISPVYRILWNATLSGSAKSVAEFIEYHLNDIPADTHTWFHLYGAIWSYGLEITNNALVTGSPNIDGRNSVVSLTTGQAIDDNLDYTITNSTAGTAWTQDMGNTTAASLNSTNSGLFQVRVQDSGGLISHLSATRFPFPFNASTDIPQFITSTGTRTDVTSTNFFTVFLYSIQEPRAGLAIKVVTATAQFTTITNARAYSWTDIQNTYIILRDTEIRPLYRLIYETRSSGGGAYGIATKYSVLRETQDIRKSAVTSTTAITGSIAASSVTNVPSGNISSTNVQSAIDELDSEKLPIAGGTMTGNLLFTDNSFDIGANGATRPRTGYFGTSIITPAISMTEQLTNTLITGTAPFVISSTTKVDNLHVARATLADTVSNATFTTALTVNTGTVTLTGNVANSSVLTIGAGAVSISGSNTGDNSPNSSTMYIGTTGVALNRTSAALTLAGITLTTPEIGAATGTSLSLSGTTSISLGTGSSLTGQAIFKNSTNNNTITLQSGATSTSYTLTLPTAVSSTTGYVLTSTDTGVLSWSANGVGSGASTALDNLASVAINTSLISDTDITDNLGSLAIRWNNIFSQVLSTGDTAGDTLKLNAYDSDGAVGVSFITLTAGNTPTCEIGDTTNRIKKVWSTDITCTNAISGSVTGNAGTVSNATFTTALTVNTGTVTLTGNVANNSVLTIGAGSVSVSGSNTGDQTISDTTILLTDITTNNATTTAHGFLLKAVAPAANLLSVVSITNGETAYQCRALFDTTNPQTIGTAGPGTSIIAARRDHVHTISLTGDVTSTNGVATTIAAKAVTLAKMDDMATASLIYRKTAGSGAPEVNTLATLKTDLGLTGTNSGDQIVPANEAGTADNFLTAYNSSTGAWTKSTINPTFIFYADQFDSPMTADWAVNAFAPAVVAADKTALIVRTFDDTAEEGVGFTIDLPAGKTNFIINTKIRALTPVATTKDIVFKLYNRDIPDNAAVSAWSAGTSLTAMTVPATNAYYQYDTQTIAFSTLGITAGRVTQFELTRTGVASGDTLAGDLYLLELSVTFS